MAAALRLDAEERWLAIAGYEGFYEVSDQGRIRTSYRRPGTGEFGHKHNTGYLGRKLCKDGRVQFRFVHQLVLEAFVGPRPNAAQAAHSNGVRTDNRLSNLRWATAKENAADRERHGNTARGERHGNAVLTEDDVQHIRRSTKTHVAVAKELGVCRSLVGYVRRGRLWKTVSKDLAPLRERAEAEEAREEAS